MINHQLNSAYNDEANNSDYASKPINNNNYIYHNKKTKRDQKENIDKDIYPFPNKRPKLDYIDSNLFSYITKNGQSYSIHLIAHEKLQLFILFK